MILKRFLVFILCYTLAFPISGISAEVPSNPFSLILSQHRDIKTGVGSMELISKNGKDLADATFKILNDPKNNKLLNTAEAIELRKHQQLLTNFLAVKNHLEKCVKDRESKRNLKDRILQSSFQNISNIDEVSIPCLPETTKMAASFLEFNNGVMKAMKNMVRPYFQNELSKQVVTNNAKSLLAFKMKFKPDFMSKGYLTKQELNDLVDDVCSKKFPTAPGVIKTINLCQKMDALFVNNLSKNLIDFSKTQKLSDKLTAEKATESLNESVDRLNNSLDKIKVKKDSGIIFDSADLKDEATKKSFDQYVNQYMAEVSQKAGTLLLTSTIKDEAGGIKSFNSDDTHKNVKTAQFQFIKHKKVNVADVRKSISEVETKMMNQATDTKKIIDEATIKKNVLTADEDDIADLVKINPFAAGQVLIKTPQYAGLMCDSINKINQDDVDDNTRNKYFVVGSAVLGGALILTGVGTIAGSYLLTGSLTAGVAAGTVGGTVLGYSALVGGASEIVSLTYQGKRAVDKYQEMNRIENAFLTSNSDTHAINEAKNTLIEYKDARMMAAIHLGSLGMNAFNASRLFNLLKSSDTKVSPEEVKAATKILKYIGETKAGNRIKEISLMMGEKAMEKIDYFLLNLAKVGEKNRLKFLELLNNSKVVPAKIKEIIEETLEAIKNCEKL